MRRCLFWSRQVRPERDTNYTLWAEYVPIHSALVDYTLILLLIINNV